MSNRNATRRVGPTPEQLLPHNVDAERGVLGSILIDGDALALAADLLSPADFYIEAHRLIYEAALALHTRGEPVDLITLTDELQRRGKLNEIGGVISVSSLANQVPFSGNAKSYAEIVERKASARRLIAAAHDIATAAYDDSSDPDGLLEYCVELVRGTEGDERRRRKEPYRLLSVQDVMNQPKPDPLIEGFYTLSSTGMMYAPPGVGKTVLLLDQMAHVALDRPWNGHAVKGGHVVYVCAEGQAFLSERLQALMLKMRVETMPRFHILPVRVQLLEAREVPRLIQSFNSALPEPPVWVAFDTVSQTANGADENDASQMAAYIGAMDRIREATGAFVDAIHHSGKDESRGARGSSVLRANCDTVIQITTTDGVAVMRCEKQRGGWAPFKPIGFKVTSLALDEHADRTGPVIEVCDAPDNSEGQPKAMPTQMRAVYDVFCRIHSEYLSHPESPGGVFFGTWEKACKESGINASTFKNARKRLMGDFNLVYQPELKGAHYPVGWKPGARPEGQDRVNCPSFDPFSPDECESDHEGQRDNPPKGIVPLSLVGADSEDGIGGKAS